MEHFHFSNGEFGQCEQCGASMSQENNSLQIVNFWYINQNSRRIPYYLYVCDTCFDTRSEWCQHIYPDQCERCNTLIEDGEHYLDKKLNVDGENIQSFGLTDDEECKIICLECANLKSTTEG